MRTRTRIRRRSLLAFVLAVGSQSALAAELTGECQVKAEFADAVAEYSGLNFETMDDLCNYKCAPGASLAEREWCAETCNCASAFAIDEGATLQTVAHCNGKALTVDFSSEHPLAGFARELGSTLRGAISSGDARQIQSCTYIASGMTAQTFDLSSEGSDTKIPHLIGVKRGYNTLDVQRALAELAGSPSRVFKVAGSTASFLLEVRPEDADLLSLRDEVTYAVVQPSLMKISQALSHSLIRSPGSGYPEMQIRFVEAVHSNVEGLVKEMNKEVQDMFGIKNLLQPGSKYAYSKSLNNSAYMMKIMEFLTNLPVVSMLQKHAPLQINPPQNLLIATKSEEEARSSELRRLDEWSHDVMGLQSLHEMGLDGSNITVGCADTGLYPFHDQFVDPNDKTVPFEEVNHDLRKVILYEAFADDHDQSDDPSGTCGHGTHVMGTIAGKSVTGKDDYGAAPAAKLAVYDIGILADTDEGPKVRLRLPEEYRDLYTNGVEAGARIFSYSWGGNSPYYDEGAAQMDQYLYENDDVLTLVAAGNEGLQYFQTECGEGTVGTPATAKNVLSIGASTNDRSSFSPMACDNYNKDAMAPFSSVGPTADGRRKPDVVAPGFMIESAESLDYEAYLDGDSHEDGCPMAGTSMATPGAAGVAALVYQWLQEGRWYAGEVDSSVAYNRPPSSLLKALLVHSAEPVKVFLPSPDDPALYKNCSYITENSIPTRYGDNMQGFGLLQPAQVLERTFEEQFFVPNPKTFPTAELKIGETHEYHFEAEVGQDFQATLVWTDPASAPSISCESTLVNDLDLEVVERGPNGEAIYTHYPVGTHGSPDRDNNVEVVRIDGEPTAKKLTVRVSAHEINVAGMQKYSLVVSSKQLAR